MSVSRVLTTGLLLGVFPLCGVVAAAGEEPQAVAAPFRPPDSGLYDHGRFVYERNCVVCHGASGDGRGEMAESLGIKPRSFRSGLFKYRSTPWGKLPTDEDLLRTIRDGRSGTAMGMFTHLSAEDMRAVVEYIKFFSRTWRKAENHAPPIVLPPPPAWLADEAQLDAHAAAGRQVFQTACAVCHGAAGDGKGPAAAALKDAGGEPAPPADLRQPHLRSGDEPIDIYRVLMTGLNGTPMASFADTLTEQQKWDVAAYALTLRRGFRGGEK